MEGKFCFVAFVALGQTFAIYEIAITYCGIKVLSILLRNGSPN